MEDWAIRVEELGKMYHIGAAKVEYPTLRESLVHAVKVPLRYILNPKLSLNGSDTIWALKDISFEVKKGEVVGIIGRNGAGKSTLLKILSHITDPTKGRMRIHGRVGSLLEVGTGFHPELTGRENIYLNGSILGMRRTEIDRKFDEIVEFSEIEKFLDTPVKRYSCGMYVRLAFAVAANLEPEILVIDEVLAVGDAEFQKKCLGKMGSVAKDGRTVLFVSHNMQAVQSLCDRAIQIEKGSLLRSGPAPTIIREYLSSWDTADREATWLDEMAPGNKDFKLVALRVTNENHIIQDTYSSNKNIYIELEFYLGVIDRALCVGFDLLSSQGFPVLRSYQTDLNNEDWPNLRLGLNRLRCAIPANLLNAGEFLICPRIGIHNIHWIVNEDRAVKFRVVLDHGISPLWNSIQDGNRPGVISPILNWSLF